MKTQLHPNYATAQVTCTCGNTFQTRSTVASLSVDNCPNCHPFYTGEKKAASAGGRVDAFRRRAARATARL